MHKNLRLAFMFPFDIISEQRERVWHHRNVNVCQRFGCRIMHNILLHFWKTCEFWSSKPKWHLSFLLLSIILISRPFRKQNFTLTVQKVNGLWFVIGRFRSFLCFCVSMFVACDGDYDWRQQWMQLIVKVAFELWSSCVCEKHNIKLCLCQQLAILKNMILTSLSLT